MYMYVYMHVYIYMYIYICVYMRSVLQGSYVKKKKWFLMKSTGRAGPGAWVLVKLKRGASTKKITSRI